MAKFGMVAALAVAGMGACVAAPFGASAPAHAQTAASKVCFKNGTGSELYFKAAIRNIGTGGSKLSPGQHFCIHKNDVVELRISYERKSAVLCTGDVVPGEVLELTSLSGAGNCSWNRSAV